MHVAVIGDIAGHLDELRRELERLGAVDDRLPDDLVVVQVGDLVHRGPDSDGVIALVDTIMRDQPAQWVQLVGNHEAQYLRPPSFDWPETIAGESVDRLQRWWADGRMRSAVAVRTPGEDFLITHAGLTAGYWREALDAPDRVGDAAAAINSFVGTHDDVLFHAGTMLGGGPPDPMAGPIWAAAASELAPSWLDAAEKLPFSQVHGHSTIADWKRRVLRAEPDLAGLVVVDDDAAIETLQLVGGRIIGVDPGHGKTPHRPWRSFELDLATIL